MVPATLGPAPPGVGPRGTDAPMRCPWCDFVGSPRRLHAHLAERHGDAVRTEERHGNHLYAVTCPECAESYEHTVRKGRRDPGFLVEFDREIRMVALDMLVHHLAAEHERPDPAAGVPDPPQTGA